MNEILLLLLIAFTLITFLSLNKKLGGTTGVTVEILQRKVEDPVYGITKVIYSGAIAKMHTDYCRLWSVTAIASMVSALTNQQNEITVIYHQRDNGSRLQPYFQQSDSDKGFISVNDKTNAFVSEEDVCVMSSISDFQYRHVLLPLDDVA